MGRFNSVLDAYMKIRHKFGIMLVSLVPIIACLPCHLSGQFTSTEKCLCDGTHYLHFNNGHIGSMSTGHKYGDYIGGYARTGLWSNDWRFKLSNGSGDKVVTGKIYSFNLFIIFSTEMARPEFHWRILLDDKIRSHLDSMLIQDLKIESEAKIHMDYWNKDFNYVTRKVLRPKGASN
jgi:hypothetical protein